jgi:hypothetical protein
VTKESKKDSYGREIKPAMSARVRDWIEHGPIGTMPPWFESISINEQDQLRRLWKVRFRTKPQTIQERKRETYKKYITSPKYPRKPNVKKPL